ncbi:hypothetical protein DERF_005237, partial [Dermatophagoides farinae]
MFWAENPKKSLDMIWYVSICGWPISKIDLNQNPKELYLYFFRNHYCLQFFFFSYFSLRVSHHHQLQN